MSIAQMNTQQISDRLLELLPQQPGFRFLDRIVAIDDTHIVGEYTFDPSLDFYKAHFPGNPVTPGVILIEAMAQTGVVAMGIYLFLKESEKNPDFDPRSYLTLFTECTMEFLKEVKPGEKVTIKGEKQYWRFKKLRSSVALYLSNGELAASGTLSGVGVKRS